MFDCVNMRDRKYMQYVVIVMLVFLLAGGLFLIRFLVQSEGSFVVVTLDGREKNRYPLTENGTYRIDGNGQDYNELVIKDGKAYILQANCGNQVCVHSNAISYQGETITCLPHKIQITIEGGKKSEYDAVTN